jgi:hypothetical protein
MLIYDTGRAFVSTVLRSTTFPQRSLGESLDTDLKKEMLDLIRETVFEKELSDLCYP